MLLRSKNKSDHLWAQAANCSHWCNTGSSWWEAIQPGKSQKGETFPYAYPRRSPSVPERREQGGSFQVTFRLGHSKRSTQHSVRRLRTELTYRGQGKPGPASDTTQPGPSVMNMKQHQRQTASCPSQSSPIYATVFLVHLVHDISLLQSSKDCTAVDTASSKLTECSTLDEECSTWRNNLLRKHRHDLKMSRNIFSCVFLFRKAQVKNVKWMLFSHSSNTLL